MYAQEPLILFLTLHEESDLHNLFQSPVDESILFQNEDIECSLPPKSNLENVFLEMKNYSPLHVEDTIISMIIDNFWYLNMYDDLQETILNINMTIRFLQCLIFSKNTSNGLDEKHIAAYEII